MNFHVNHSKWAGKDVRLTDYYAKEGRQSLPNSVNSENRYDYYPRSYLQYSLLANLVTGNTIVAFTWEYGYRVNGLAKAVPGEYALATGFLDLYLAFGAILSDYAGISLHLLINHYRLFIQSCLQEELMILVHNL